MRVLLSNDDGINAPGFAVLEEIAAAISDDIWVVAPAEEQSARNAIASPARRPTRS
jgi:5'-nucleotidase